MGGGLLRLMHTVVAERQGPWVADDSEHTALAWGWSRLSSKSPSLSYLKGLMLRGGHAAREAREWGRRPSVACGRVRQGEGEYISTDRLKIQHKRGVVVLIVEIIMALVLSRDGAGVREFFC